MKRNRFNQAKQQSGKPLLGSAITNNLTTNKARQLFLEDDDNIDMKDNYKIIITHPPIDEILFLIKSIMTITYYLLQIKSIF